jgi:hypothetical protein
MLAEKRKSKGSLRKIAESAVKLAGLTAFWTVFGPALAYQVWRYHKRDACKRD